MTTPKKSSIRIHDNPSAPTLGPFVAGGLVMPEQLVMKADEPSDLMTAPQVAKLLGIDRTTVYEAANRGELPHRRIGRRMLFSRSAVTEWMRGNSLPEAPPRRRRRRRS